MISIVNQIFPIYADMSDKQMERVNMAKSMFYEAVNCEDNANFKGTAWGLINAYTDYMTHAPALRNTKSIAENKFINVTFDGRLMSNFMNVLKRNIV